MNIRPFYTLYALVFASLVFAFLKHRVVLKALKIIKIPLILLVLTSLYALFVDVEYFNSNSYAALFLRIIVEAILPSLFIAYMARHWNMSLMDVLNSLVLCGVVQFLIALLMLSDFNVKMYLLHELLGMSYDKLVLGSPIALYRGFGLSINHLYAFAFVQGILAVLCLLLLIHSTKMVHKAWYVFAFVGNLALIVLNARIGFLPLGVLAAILPVIIIFRWRMINKKLLLTGVFFMFVVAPAIVGESENQTGFSKALNRALEGLEDSTNAISSGESTGAYAMLARHFHFPDDEMIWLFGEGHRLYPGSKYYSDVGYVRFTYFGGVSFSFLAYMTFAVFSSILLVLSIRGKISMHVSRIEGGIMPWLMVVFVVSLFVAHFKGEIFLLNDATRLLVFFVMLFVFRFLAEFPRSKSAIRLLPYEGSFVDGSKKLLRVEVKTEAV
ncbi:MAG: hypothetical protein OEZ43_14535 [Gammaproteobacteria bacterium]|nr:hypothetical protein [Gammaproteobacteria bacterium]